MPALRRLTLPALLLGATLALAACDSPEERAEKYYQSALVFLDDGDLDRAKVELMNVFENDRFHEEARRTRAEIALEEDDEGAAFRNYLFIVEETPDTADVRLILAELALRLGNFAEAKRHGEVAIALLPDEPRAMALQAAFDYEQAREDNDDAAAAAALAQSQALLTQMPENDVSRRIVIDDLLRSDDPTSALPAIDEALRLDPDAYGYNQLKLRLLGEQQDMAAIGAHLRSMVALYPEDTETAQTLIRWYLAEDDLAGAEAFLRQLAGDDDAADPAGHLTVVQFLQGTQGIDAARLELERLAEANSGAPNADLYAALAAVIVFEQGDQDTAIATLEQITNAPPADEDAPTNANMPQIKVMLAKLLEQTGNTVGARAEVEEILATDPSNVDALKMRATWAIRDDNAQSAIVDLRTALSQAPRDADILSLLAQAHERDGSKALAGERLAQAVEVTDSRAAEALRYAAFLLADDRRAAAINVLADARAAAPENVDVLATLGEQLLEQQSWLQVQRIVSDLEQVGTEQALEVARSFNAAILFGQGRIDESISFLQNQIADGATDTRTVLQLVQLNLQNQNPDEARRLLDEAMAANPDNQVLQLTDANLRSALGDPAGAETILRDLMVQAPLAEAPVRQLYTLLRAQGQTEEASAILLDALERQPQSTNLFWVRASELEQAGDIEGAIAVYETMYEADSSSVLVANNLASLITSYRDDPESLARAAAIAKRLRDTDIPALQDTYGWIAYRNGDVEEALPYLRSAAAGLPNDPVVQIHYGIALAADAQNAAARDALTRGLELAPAGTAGAQYDEARRLLETLPTE